MRASLPRLLAALFLFVSLLAPALVLATEGEGWPREIETEKGLVTMYQPQIDSFLDDQLKGRAAVSVTATDQDPVFGAVWLEARALTDREERTFTPIEITVPRVRFPETSEEREKQLISLLETEMPKWDLTMSLDRLIASLELAERNQQATHDFDDKPPIILFRQEPAILVLFDGEPRLVSALDADLRLVANTAFNIILDKKKGDYYLYAGEDAWYKAALPLGPWEFTKRVPKKIKKALPDSVSEAAKRTPPTESSSDATPQIVTATEPTELIVSEGAPQYSPVGELDLLYMSNTESDILVEVESQRHFVLLSGRWFAGPSTDGPWEFVAADALPASFAEIPEDSEVATLKTWVAGTDAADEASYDANVPQTAAIRRDSMLVVTFDGTPQFAPIEGTDLEYAKNTSFQVLKLGEAYYCADDGVWYVAGKPTGPWKVATEIPQEIYQQPPSSPHYNTKYVYVYDSTPEVVYTGYYPGYMHSYYYNGSMVYGTGWYYGSWWGPHYYYPWHSTWGFHMRWNPWYGWGGGFSWSSGRWSFGIGYSGYGRGYYGPGGYRPYYRGYNRGWYTGVHSGYRAGYRAGQGNQYRSTNLYAQPTNRARNAAIGAGAAGIAAGGSRPAVSSMPNNVYTDRSGNVHRRSQDGSWQNRQNGQWGGTTPSSSAGNLSRDYGTRQRGNARAGGFSRSGGGRRR